jgi:hypothetical protein
MSTESDPSLVAVPTNEVPPLIKHVERYDAVQADYLAAAKAYYYAPTIENSDCLKRFSAYTASAFRAAANAIVDMETLGAIAALRGFMLAEDTERIRFHRQLTRSIRFVEIAGYEQDVTEWLQDTIIATRGDYQPVIEGLASMVQGLLNSETLTLHERVQIEAEEQNLWLGHR